MNPNEVARIIIQLILSALLFFLFSFKYKPQLITLLSEQVYYQALIILVILSGYFSKWLDLLRGFICHWLMMCFSKKYKLRHYKESVSDLAQQTQTAAISEEAKAMMAELTSSDFELEDTIKKIHTDLNKVKGK